MKIGSAGHYVVDPHRQDRGAQRRRDAVQGRLDWKIALKKREDERELYLLPESSAAAALLELDPKNGKEARAFAGQVNAASRAARTS
jgi:hypothetical protein